MNQEKITPELHRPLSVYKIPDIGTYEVIEATAQEREQLAKRFSLLDLTKLTADLTIKPLVDGKAISVQGTIKAHLSQACIVTLEPVITELSEDIHTIFVPPALMQEEGAEITLDMESVETEVINNGMIDLGELVAQNLALTLDPYPRKEGAELPEKFAHLEKETPTSKPFASLVKSPDELNKK